MAIAKELTDFAAEVTSLLTVCLTLSFKGEEPISVVLSAEDGRSLANVLNNAAEMTANPGLRAIYKTHYE